MEAQEKALAEASLLEPDRLYRDILKPEEAKWPARVRPEWLAQRATMLRPTARQGDVIAVATLLALAVSERDLADVLAAAAKNRRATIRAVDSGLVIDLGGGMAEAAAAIADWQRARLQSRARTTKIAGNVAAAAAKRKATIEKLKVARPLWNCPSSEISTDEIASRSGLSIKTLYAELGRRSAAQNRRRRK